jgi:hypothetical protein
MQNVVLLKSNLESDVAAAIYLSEAPPRYTLYIYILVHIYPYLLLFTQKKGEVGNRGESTDHNAGSKIPT